MPSLKKHLVLPSESSETKVADEIKEESQNTCDLSGVELSIVAEQLASMVAVSGDDVEMVAKLHNANEEKLS